MHAAYLLGLAALAHGFVVSDAAPKTASPWRSLIQRNNAGLDARDDDNFLWCPENQDMPNLPEAVKFQPLNTTDLGNAQNALMQWCAENNKLAPSGGQNGHVETSGDVAVQLCNVDRSPMSCTSDQIKGFFEKLNCGPQDTPHMGAIFNAKLDALDQTTFTVAMTPKDNVIQCQKPTRH